MRHPTELDEPLVATCLSGLGSLGLKFWLGEVEVGMHILYCFRHKH